MTATITTERLLLRPIEPADAAALVCGLNNFAVSRWTARIPFPYGEKDAAEFIALCAVEKPGVLRRAITVDGQLIGVIGLESEDGGKTLEIGYWIAEPQWGKGYASEAARAMVDHAFGEMGCTAITARYTIGNTGSRRILLGLGFAELGEATCTSRATASDNLAMQLALSRSGWAQAKGRRR
jgi:RimJ/RimL family protein N-acetyltransferase